MTSAKFDRKRDALVKDFSDVLAEAEMLLKQAAKESYENATDLRAQVEAKLRFAKVRLADLQDDATDRAKAAARVTDDYVRDNPWQAIAIGAVLGFALARAFRRTQMTTSNVDFHKLINEVADRFQVDQGISVSQSARSALFKPALPHKESVEKALASGDLTIAFLRSGIWTVLTNAHEIASEKGERHVAEESVLASMRRYCPIVFWC